MTIDDWAALDEDDSRELVDGVLEEAEVPSVLHEVEVVSSSPEDERRDRIAKPQDYAELGARHYWIVDPWLRTLEIFELDERGRYVRVLAATGGSISDVPGLPELTLDVDAMWAEIDRIAG